MSNQSACIAWPGAIDSYGYGRLSCPKTGRWLLAHRVAYERDIGPIPDGLVIDHLCRNRTCVNASHMEPVTNVENVMRGFSPAAINARKTHCKNGHPFDSENTSVCQAGRRCKTCHRDDQRRYLQRKQQNEVAA